MKRRTIWIPRQQEEVDKQMERSDKALATLESGDETPPADPPKGMEEEEKTRKDPRWMEAISDTNQQRVEWIQDEEKSQQIGKTEGKKLTETAKRLQEKDDTVMEGTEQEKTGTITKSRGQQDEMPKKRQRTILEYIEQSQQEDKETENPNGDKKMEQKQRLQMERQWEEENYQQGDMQSVEEAAGKQDSQASNQIVAERKQQQKRQ